MIFYGKKCYALPHGSPVLNTTSGPKTCASNCCLAMSFCRTGSSTSFSPGNSVGGQTLLNSCLFTCMNWSTKALSLLANQLSVVLYHLSCWFTIVMFLGFSPFLSKSVHVLS